MIHYLSSTTYFSPQDSKYHQNTRHGEGPLALLLQLIPLKVGVQNKMSGLVVWASERKREMLQEHYLL